jgi:hypothetical protein
VVDITEDVDGFCPVRSQVSLEHWLVNQSSCLEATAYFGHDVLRAPIVTFFVVVLTW